MLIAKLFLLGQVVTFWPVWRWYITRMIDGSDEPWGIIALVTMIFLVLRKATWQAPSITSIVISSVIAVLYMAGYDYLPALFKGVLAVSSIALSMSSICYGKTVKVGVAGLMLLSLPLIASLQFYGGFPIRVITAYLSSHLLGLFGYQVYPQGTLLFWLGEVIAVDAPCAGIKMLWTGLYLNFSLAAVRELNFLITWLSTSVTLFAVFIGNICRATLLFFTESGIINAPEYAHQGIGLIVFAIVAVTVMSFHHINQQRVSCGI